MITTTTTLSSTRTEEDYERLARCFDALAHKNRLRLLWIIAENGGRLAVDELVERLFPLSQPCVSHHLAVMRDAGLLTRKYDGLRIYYRINPKGLIALQKEIGQLLEMSARNSG